MSLFKNIEVTMYLAKTTPQQSLRIIWTKILINHPTRRSLQKVTPTGKKNRNFQFPAENPRDPHTRRIQINRPIRRSHPGPGTTLLTKTNAKFQLHIVRPPRNTRKMHIRLQIRNKLLPRLVSIKTRMTPL